VGQLHRRTRGCVIVDYGMGNLWSVASAIRYLGHTPQISNKPQDLQTASHVILPGVGSFRLAIESLNERGLADGIRDFVDKGNGFLLGICLGLQLLAAASPEDGQTAGFGYFPHAVERFSFPPTSDLPIPHVGYNSVSFSHQTGIFSDLQQGSYFYFVHSYRLAPALTNLNTGLTHYGETFVAAIDNGQVAGTQFHPEKSQTNGLRLLKNFLHRR